MAELKSSVNDAEPVHPPMRKPEWYTEALQDVKDDLRAIATKYRQRLEFREGRLRVRR